jgi:hypothetical protein
MRFFQGLSLIHLACLLTSAAGAETFRARLGQIPAQNGTDCDGYAVQLGDRFAAEYQVRVVEAICDQSEFERTTWAVAISYDAEHELPLVSTVDRYKPLSEQATYKTQPECDAALATEVPLFESRTALKVFTSFCVAPEYQNDGWALAISGFGNATVKPFVVSTPYFGKIVDMTGAAFEQMLRDGFQASGAEMVHWQVSPKLGYGMMSVRYYGTQKLPMQGMELSKMRSPEECTAQLEDFRAALYSYSSVGYASYCHQVFGMGREYELVWLTGSEEQHRVVTVPAEYPDFASCQAAKSAVVERYRTELRRNVVFGVCGAADTRNAYRVSLLEKPRS